MGARDGGLRAVEESGTVKKCRAYCVVCGLLMRWAAGLPLCGGCYKSHVCGVCGDYMPGGNSRVCGRCRAVMRHCTRLHGRKLTPTPPHVAARVEEYARRAAAGLPLWGD